MSGGTSYSLRRQLVWLLTGALATIWLVSMLVVYQRAHHEADELLDSQLMQVAETLLAIVAGGEIGHFAKDLYEHAGSNPVPIAFEIWHTEHGTTRRLATSPGHETFEVNMAKGFSEQAYQGKRWRFYAVQDKDAEYRVVVGQAHAARNRLAREVSLSLLLPALLALPWMAFAVWWAVGRALRPLEALARQVGALDAQALVPLDTAPILPNEIAPLRGALNALIQRVNEAFENERRFTADAAHELRTPLAALKVQAQVAQRAQTPESQQHALAQVSLGVDRMAHLVEQLLTLARIDPAHQGNVSAPFDPATIITGICADALPQARRQGQVLTVELEPGCRVNVIDVWLKVAVRNLVDNALRYAGDGAHIDVRLARHGTACTLSVVDDGPGVAAALRSKLSARFVRGDAEGEGSGLGLSIVARIAARAGGRLELSEGRLRTDGGRGFAATLHFDAI